MNELLKKTDVCVKCGLCLPYCPTYHKTQNENDSPRGRIALIQAWATGQLNNDIIQSIDRCLLCRECERVCPALVPYGQIIDEFRFLQPQKPNLATHLLNFAISHKTLAKFNLKLYQNTILKTIVQYLKLPQLFGLQTVERLLTEYQDSPTFNEYYSANNAQDTVGLFIGCLGELFDSKTIYSAITVLNRIGFNVVILKGCCGALAAHSGDKQTAEQLSSENQRLVANKNLNVIISIASGCGSQLQDTLNYKVLDISQFLENYNFFCQPLNKIVYLHTPCSLRNAMRSENAPLSLLKQIPELTIMPLPSICCGSAGSYLLKQPDMAKVLLNDVLNELEKTNADYLLTSNIGCALHIKAGIRERGLNSQVLHPITLLANALNPL